MKKTAKKQTILKAVDALKKQALKDQKLKQVKGGETRDPTFIGLVTQTNDPE